MNTLTRPHSNYTNNSISNSNLGMDNNSTSNSTQTREIKISKRVNARLQLAAALIEADNEEVEESKIKLASKSAIFSPYRGQGQSTDDAVRGETQPTARLDSEGRPVIDFLGVKLPAEKRLARSTEVSEDSVAGERQRALSPFHRPHSSIASSEWPSRPASGIQVPSSRPVSVVSTSFSQRNSVQIDGEEQDTEEVALTEWRVEKFLSSEAKDRIERGRRSRANSTIERPQSVMSDSSMGRAHSEIGTEASALPTGDLTISKLDLMARIKMYREGQEQAGGELQQEQDIKKGALQEEQPPYKLLNEDRLRGHLEALARVEGSNIGIIPQVRNNIIGGRKSIDLVERAQSNSGVMGDSWSDQGDENNETDLEKVSEAPEDYFGMKQIAESNEAGMAGIGSFSRSPHSRSHSRASITHSAGLSPEMEEQGFKLRRPSESHGHNSGQASRPHSPVAFKMYEGQSTLDVGKVRRQSLSHLGIPNTLGPRISDTSSRRLSMLNPAFSPRLKPTQDTLLASIDPYFDMAGSNFGPYPTIKSLDASYDALIAPSMSRRGSEQLSTSMHGLSTKQLQELAKQNSFPASFGMSTDYLVHAGLPDEDAELLKGEHEIFQAEEIEQPANISIPTQREQPVLHSSLLAPLDFPLEGEAALHDKETSANSGDIARPIESFIGANQEPDLSSARWGRKKRKSLLATRINLRKPTLPSSQSKVAEEVFLDIGDDNVDDEYTSPAMKGPLRPRGIESRLPAKLEMPKPLQGTSLAPRRRLVEEQVVNVNEVDTRATIRVPEGFVLHNRLETVSMKTLKVHGASGAKPFFMNPVGKQKHDQMISNFLTSQGSQRLIPVPLAAPPGIGRRAAMNTTALFRNQLVQHEEEKEGWGWEATNRIGTELIKVEEEEEDEENLKAGLTSKKEIRKEKKLAKKMQRKKQKRKEARRVRRKKREMAKSKDLSLEEAGVEELSPDEDLDLSETSSDESIEGDSDSEMSWNSEDEARWVDEKIPAGRLYGKSLLDVMDERKMKVTSKARQYGQVRMEEIQGDNQSISATTVGGGASSFRDNPIGFNDTKERMEAAFGPDTIWAKEMAKRQIEEAQETKEREIQQMALAELEAEEVARKDAKKSKKKESKVKANEEVLIASLQVEEDEWNEEPAERSQTSVKAPTINLELPSDSHLTHKTTSLSGAAAKWLESDDEDASSNESEAEAIRRKEALQRARMSRSLGGKGLNKVNYLHNDDSDSSSEEDDVPLSRLRANRTSNTIPSMKEDDSSEEEISLSQLVMNRKRETQNLGSLDLNFMTGETSPSQSIDLDKQKSQPNQLSDDEDDEPIGLKLADAQATLQQLTSQHREQFNDDDRPLGIAHPQAAIITEQANVIKQLQNELILKQQLQQQQFQPIFPAPYGYPSSHMSMLPTTPFMPSFPSQPMVFPMVNPDQQQASSIASWAAEVPLNTREENM